MIGVYEINNTITNRSYVGSSFNVSKRFVTHKSKLNNNKHHCDYLQRSWNKYGANVFEFKLISETDTLQDAREFEQLILDEAFEKLYNSKNTAVGAGTGDSNPMKNQSTARKVSEKRKGIKFSESHIANIRAARKGAVSPMKGKRHSDSSKEKMRAAKLNKLGNRAGKLASEETRKRISQARRGLKIGKYASLICPHCNKEGSGGAMHQWHFNNCKHKEN